MKKILTSIFTITTLLVFCQTPQGINYQSVIRNSGGTVMASTPVTVEFKLYDGLAGIMLYDETHSTTTNSFGMANLVIGQGTVVGGSVTFNNIPWMVGVAYEVYVNSNLVGSRQLFMSVPYALHAASAPAPNVTFSNNVLSVGNNTVSITSGNTYTGGSGINITGNTITNSAPDQSVTISATGAATVTGTYPNFTVSAPNGTSLPMAVNGQFLYNNGTIWDTLPRNNLYFDGTNFGIGTTNPQANLHVNGDGKFNASVTTPHVFTNTITISGGAAGQVLTSDGVGNGSWQSPAAVSSASLSVGNSNLALIQSGNAYTITPVTPTFNTVGNVNIGGTYPNQTITVNPQVLSVAGNSVVSLSNGGGSVNLTPATLTYTAGTNTLKLTHGSASSSVLLNSTPSTTVSQGPNINVIGSGASYTVSAPAFSITTNSNTLTLSNGSAITTATVPVGSTLSGGIINRITKWNSATTVGNSSMVENGGNIGIGTLSPAAKLDIVGTFKLADGTEGAGKFLVSDGVGNASWNLPPAAPWVKNSTNVTLANIGDWVGIGTPTPNSPFQVASYISFENAGSNTALGFNTGGGVTPNNYYNTFVGSMAGQAVGTGTASSNSFLGYQAGQNNGNGDNNTFVGANAGTANNIGSDNSFFGTGAGKNSTGISNVFVGHDAGSNTTTASRNTFIGDMADLLSTIQYTNATAIGYNTKVNGNDMLALGNKSDVVIGGTKAGIIAGTGLTRYLTVANTTTYAAGSNTSLELQGYTNSANTSAAKIDFINLTSNIARIEAITASGSTVQGSLRFFTNAGTLTEAMRITTTGNVGIGVTNPGGLFELALDQGRKPGSGTWTIASDERLKNIDGNYTKGLAEILKLQPIVYHYKNVGEREFTQEVINTSYAGFSAQEVQKIFPEAVGVDADGYLNLNVHAILIAYTNAIKELNTKNEEQQKNIEEQKTALEELQLKYEERLRKLEAALEAKTQK